MEKCNHCRHKYTSWSNLREESKSFDHGVALLHGRYVISRKSWRERLKFADLYDGIRQPSLWYCRLAELSWESRSSIHKPWMDGNQLTFNSCNIFTNLFFVKLFYAVTGACRCSATCFEVGCHRLLIEMDKDCKGRMWRWRCCWCSHCAIDMDCDYLAWEWNENPKNSNLFPDFKIGKKRYSTPTYPPFHNSQEMVMLRRRNPGT